MPHTKSISLKKEISILLLFSLFIPSLGTFLWFQHHQREIRKEVKELLLSGLDDSQLELLTFTQYEVDHVISWKHSEEFEHHGFMYDIVKRKLENGTHSFWCWKDDKETLLSQKLEDLLANLLGNNPQEQQKQKHLQLFLTTIFQSKMEHWEPIIPFDQKAKIAITYLNNYRSISMVPIAPPPLLNEYRSPLNRA